MHLQEIEGKLGGDRNGLDMARHAEGSDMPANEAGVPTVLRTGGGARRESAAKGSCSTIKAESLTMYGHVASCARITTTT